MNKTKVIDEIFNELESRLDDKDHIMLIYVNEDAQMLSSTLYTRNPAILISSICDLFDSSDGSRGQNMQDVFMSAILSYAKLNPVFATNLIKNFNKAMYGIEEDYDVAN